MKKTAVFYPNSSNVKGVNYFFQREVLRVTTKSGIYEYFKVPEEIFNQLLNAHLENASVGKLFNSLVVRGNFDYKKYSLDYEFKE